MDISTIKNSLAEELFINIADEWLNLCLLQIGGWRNKTLKEVLELVKTRWLISDMGISSVGSLPEGLSESPTVQILNGKHTLQIICLQDISQPTYSQLNILTGKDNQNALVSAEPQNFEPKPNRLIMLGLTDGKQKIQGMEITPIPAISTNTTPGTKILICGPIQCSMGALFLTKDNVRVLGGYEENLEKHFSQENMCRRALGLPIAEPTANTDNRNVESGAGDQIAGPPARDIDSDEFPDDDDNFLNSNLQLIEELERMGTAGSATVDLTNSTTPPLPPAAEINNSLNSSCSVDIIDAIFEDTQTVNARRNRLSKNKSTTPAQPSKVHPFFDKFNKKKTPQSTVTSGTETTVAPRIESSVTPVVNNVHNNQVFTYLSECLKEKDKVGTKVINGSLGKFVNKLSMVDQGWMLKVLVNDSTGSIEADISSDFLTKQIGHDPLVFSELKKQSRSTRDYTLQNELKMSLQKCQKFLSNMNGLITLEFNSKHINCPRLIDFEEIDEDVATLKQQN